ncbi:MAG: ribokinase [Micromonosporaceae bacterium]
MAERPESKPPPAEAVAGAPASAAPGESTAAVVVVGSANLDLVATTPALPAPGETVLGHRLSTVPGGKGANQATAAARAGARCGFIGAVGDDAYGPLLRRSLEESGVDTSQLRVVPGSSGVAMIAVADDGENSIVVVPGANATVTGLTVADRAAITAADILLCQLEVPLSVVASAAEVARDAGTFVLLNAAPAQPLPERLLGSVDLLVVNQVEAAALGGDLSRYVPRVVTTLGPQGAGYLDRDGIRVVVPAPAVTAVDTTAAGDAFAGALAVAWAERRDVADALRWACAAGAVCAQRPGASAALPYRAEIDSMYQETYR